MLFYLATMIVNDLFSTEHDSGNNMSSSNLELSHRYENNQAEQAAMRQF